MPHFFEIDQVTDQSTGPKFRLVLPLGQAPPPGYVQVGKRTLPMGEISPDQFDHRDPKPHHDYVQLPSGLVLQAIFHQKIIYFSFLFINFFANFFDDERKGLCRNIS